MTDNLDVDQAVNKARDLLGHLAELEDNPAEALTIITLSLGVMALSAGIAPERLGEIITDSQRILQNIYDDAGGDGALMKFAREYGH